MNTLFQKILFTASIAVLPLLGWAEAHVEPTDQFSQEWKGTTPTPPPQQRLSVFPDPEDLLTPVPSQKPLHPVLTPTQIASLSDTSAKTFPNGYTLSHFPQGIVNNMDLSAVAGPMTSGTTDHLVWFIPDFQTAQHIDHVLSAVVGDTYTPQSVWQYVPVATQENGAIVIQNGFVLKPEAAHLTETEDLSSELVPPLYTMDLPQDPTQQGALFLRVDALNDTERNAIFFVDPAQKEQLTWDVYFAQKNAKLLLPGTKLAINLQQF